MSREPDSSSSGTQGRGGNAYPSGTPPYGARPFPSLHPQEPQRPAGVPEPDEGTETAPPSVVAPAADEPKTETTLTTRIRINIPGSRPIPPVVMRTPVDDSGPAPATVEPEPAVEEPAPEPEPGAERTSDWFAPRKPAATPPAPPSASSPSVSPSSSAPAAAPPASPLGGEVGAPPRGAPPGTGAAAPGFNDPGSGSHRAPNPLGGQNGSSPYLPPPVGTPLDDPARGPHDTPATGFPSPFDERPQYGAGGPPLGPDGSDTGSVQRPFFGGEHPFGPDGLDTGSGPYPFGSDTGSGPHPFGPDGSDTGSGRRPFGSPSLFPPDGGTDTGSGPRPFGPGGSDTGSVQRPFFGGEHPFGPDGLDTGSGPYPFGPDGLDTGSGPHPFGPDGSDTGSGPRPYGTEDFPPGVPRPTGDSADPFAEPGGPYGAAGAAPYAEPAAPPADSPFPGHQRPAGMPPAGEMPRHVTGDFRMAPAGEREEPAGQGGPPPEPQVSSDTLVSGIPAVGSGPRVPRPGPPAPSPAKEEAEPAAKPAAAKPAKKGRSKIMLLGIAVGVVAVMAYGAGLMLDHAAVPKGTTVLGVDIGDQNRDGAVKKLNHALGNRTTAPLTLMVGNRKQALKPSVAGLSIDTDATVKAVAHADYNPVTVVDSLFGSKRKADPVIVVDEDKLKVALKAVAGASSSGSDGMVRFTGGKAVAVPGRAGQSFNVDDAASKVAAAYRARAETGVNVPVTLTVSTVPPKVSQAELTAAVNGFGRTAMLGPVTLRVNASHKIAFNTSLPKFLTMEPDAAGHLKPHFDLNMLRGLYGRTFDGILIRRADGSKSAVTAQDVADALVPGLQATKAADRVVNFQNLAK